MFLLSSVVGVHGVRKLKVSDSDISNISILYFLTVGCYEGELNGVLYNRESGKRVHIVQICIGGKWSCICYGNGSNQQYWDDIDAQVACQQLGFPSSGKILTH